MDYFPLFADLENKSCLVVGGGAVALRKIRLLREARARVTIVSPTLHDELVPLLTRDDIAHIDAEFNPVHLNNNLLVIAATNKPEINTWVYAEASARNMLCNSVDDPQHSSFITPAIVDRAPLTIAISSAGKAPVLARLIRENLERTLPVSLGLLARVAGNWRQRVKAALGTLTARRYFWEDVFGDKLESIAPGLTEQQVDELVAEQLRVHSNGLSSAGVGEAWLVGAGPGDPALLTIRAQQLLQRADVILHDRLVSKEILALARRDAEFIDVGKPLAGTGCASAVQDSTTQLLLELVGKGLRVCRLKGGDPFIFGRGGEEVTALAEAGLPFQIVPGITAAAACAAYAGIPLTHRDFAQSVVLLTGHGKNSIDQLDWASLARDRQTLAVYMGVAHYTELSRNLILHGRSGTTPIAVIERGTTAQQRVHTSTLKELAGLVASRRIQAPAMLIIGSVAKFADSQGWFMPTPVEQAPPLALAN
ncbi:MAG: siroheme synthase CysG [Gammaproteobacteria bacterium]